MARKTVSPKKSSHALAVFSIAALLVALLAAVSVVFIFPLAVKMALASHFSKTVGVQARIDRIEFRPAQFQFSIKGLRFSNPKDFPAGELAHVGEVKVNYQFSPIMMGWFDAKRAEIYFQEFRLVRNEAGHLNLPALPGGAPQNTIEEVVLNLGSVTYTDLSQGEPIQQTFDVGLSNATYRNIQGVSGVAEIVNWEILKRTGIGEKGQPAPPAAAEPPTEPAPEMIEETVPAPAEPALATAEPAESKTA